MHATARTRQPVFGLALMLTVLLAGCEVRPTTASATFSAPTLGVATPEAVGMSSDRLKRLTSAMQSLVDEGRLAGITTMVSRRGQVAHSATYGYRDLEAADPMTEDAIFRIYSMSKPITGVALMMLYEEGKFRLSDPVERYIPEFTGLKVAAGVGRNGPIVEDADHPMTIRELMTHSAGLTYGIFSRSQVDSMYRAVDMLDTDGTLKDMIDKLARIPLRQQPGSQWHYSVSTDVQGYLVEVLSGQSFEEFLHERIFEPLGMIDTGFHIPPEKTHRFAQVYDYDDDGALVAQEGLTDAIDAAWTTPATFFSGGGGLVSTTGDYMRFAQMVLNEGVLDGVRLLSPTTVQLMRTNHLPAAVGEFAPGLGFGLDFAVVTDPVAAEGISNGEFYWGGAAGTWFWIDPVEDLVFVGMIQQFGQGRPDVRSLSRRLVYQSIIDMAN